MKTNFEKTSLTRAFIGVRIFWHYTFRHISSNRKNAKKKNMRKSRRRRLPTFQRIVLIRNAADFLVAITRAISRMIMKTKNSNKD